MPIVFLYSKRYLNNSVNNWLIKTSVISLALTPATKVKPPLCPLLMLCLIMEKMIGPTEMANIMPKRSPLIKAAIMKTE